MQAVYRFTVETMLSGAVSSGTSSQFEQGNIQVVQRDGNAGNTLSSPYGYAKNFVYERSSTVSIRCRCSRGMVTCLSGQKACRDCSTRNFVPSRVRMFTYGVIGTSYATARYCPARRDSLYARFHSNTHTSCIQSWNA